MTTATSWQWNHGERRSVRERITTLLWLLHHEGPALHPGGRALAILAERAQARGVRIFDGKGGIYYTLRTLTERYPDAIEVERDSSATYGVRLLLPRASLPQPDPFGSYVAPEDVVAPASLVPAGPATPGQLAPGDALAAVASFVAEAMRMAGVERHDVTADERLQAALAENQRLQEAYTVQAEQLLARQRECEVLRLALARRNGATP